MIVVISNRNIVRGANDHTVFGDQPNAKGLDELRVATAQFDDVASRWRVELLPERRTEVTSGRPPSRRLFDRILAQVASGALSSDWTVFVHGFNQSFAKNLAKCRAIEQLYGTNVLAFSWPSRQGGLVMNEYKKARGAARGSTNAFDRTMDKLGTYLRERPFRADCAVRLNLMAYSMGSYVVENFVRAPVFADEVGIFDNVVLTQADVDLDGHAEWIEKLSSVRRVYVTINEDDAVLKWSGAVNPPRLGNTVRKLAAPNTVYFDFTEGRGVGSTHGIFYKTAASNPVVHQVFKRALSGRRAEAVPGVEHNPDTGAYELIDKD